MLSSRILILDADVATQRLLEGTLAGFGYGVDLASNAAEGLSLIASTPYRLVFLGASLRDMDSMDCFAKMRRVQRSLCGVYISQEANWNTVWFAMTSGFSNVISKPVDPREVLQLVENCAEEGESVNPLPELSEGGDQVFSLSRIAEMSRSDVTKMPRGALIALVRSVQSPLDFIDRLEFYDRALLERFAHAVVRSVREAEGTDVSIPVYPGS